MDTWAARRRLSAGRLFAVYAVTTLVPVLVLGLLLGVLLDRQQNRRGLDEGIARARLVAGATVTPLLDGDPTTTLSADEYARLMRSAEGAVHQGQVLRLRLRDLQGRIVFPRSTSTATDEEDDDDDAQDAARGTLVAHLTHLNSDDPDLPAGPRVVEVYLPLTNLTTGTRIGVLEIYLPYAPIARAIAASQRTVFYTLLAGLLVLWLCLIGVTASVIGRLRRNAKANEYLAGHDLLTGLANRVTFDSHLTSVAATGDHELVVAIIAVDGFRHITNALGHANSAAVLRVVGQRLAAALSGADLVARLDGGDFAVVGVDVAVPESWLGALRDAVRAPLEVDGLPLAADVTAGYDRHANANADPARTLARAAVALSAARRRGVHVLRYAAQDDQFDARALSLVAELAAAIADDQLVLHFQPKHSIEDGRLTSVEALVRWQHPTRGLLYPDAFLAAVEHTELIEDLTDWVLRQACRAARQLDPEVHVAVNISARSLGRPDFAAGLTAIVAEQHVRTQQIILEITETAIIADPELTRRTLVELRAAGFRISIDDFGAGHTSLSHLTSMPIDELKIDRAFVARLLEDRRSASVVATVVELGHNLGISVTAEGVETESMLVALRRIGCDVAQGYFLHRPMPLADLLVLPGAASPALALLGD